MVNIIPPNQPAPINCRWAGCPQRFVSQSEMMWHLNHFHMLKDVALPSTRSTDAGTADALAAHKAQDKAAEEVHVTDDAELTDPVEVELRMFLIAAQATDLAKRNLGWREDYAELHARLDYLLCKRAMLLLIP